VTNPNGNKVFLSEDGLRRVRFDINHPEKHEFPHFQIESNIGGQWEKSGVIFPSDILK